MTLAKLSYADIHRRLDHRPSDELLRLLDDRSVKVGDTAADLLATRQEWEMVLDALVIGKLKTRNGKVRGLNLLKLRGRKLAGAINAYLLLIRDKHPDVVGCALFGIVFWNDRRNIKAVQSINNSRAHHLVGKAIAALRKGDPTIYSPYFFDEVGVWRKSRRTVG